MRVSFIASHSQGGDLKVFYDRILKFLKDKTYSVYTGSLFEKDIPSLVDEDKRRSWYEANMREIKRSDVVIVEISYPSTANVGHELTYALSCGVPVVALFKDGRDPLFLKGLADDKLTINSYNGEDLEMVLDESIDYALTQQDTRFNFFISPRIGNYLDWISKAKRIPRAVYLRRLIEEDMKKSKEFVD